MAHRLGGWCMAAGVVLAAASAALHPPTVHPGSGDLALAAIALRPARWVAVHWLLVAALVLWLGGYLLLDQHSRHRGWCRLSAWNRVLVATALAAWLVLLAFEVEAMPRWALAAAGPEGPAPAGATPGAPGPRSGAGAAPTDSAAMPGRPRAAGPDVARAVAGPLFAASLTLAYVATALLWLAQALWALDLGRAGALPPCLAAWGWASAALAALGIPAAVWLARGSPYPGVAVLAVTAGLAGLWHGVIGIRFATNR